MGQRLTTSQKGRKRHGRPPLPWFALVLSGLCAAVFWLFGPLSEILVYDKEAIAGGELWRLVTGHLVHVNTGHLLLNVAALFPLAWFLERGIGIPPAKLISMFLISILAIDAWLFVGLPWIDQYVGLSAYLNGLYSLLMLFAWRKSGHKVFLLFLTGDALKIAYEGLTNTSIFTSLPWPPVPTAHAVGFAAGVAFFFILRTDVVNHGFLKKSNSPAEAA